MMPYKGTKLRNKYTTGNFNTSNETTHSVNYSHTCGVTEECRACYIEKLTQRFKNYDLNK